jgi:uncharacterized protein YaeQ
MAIKATIFKAELQVSDLDRGHFETHALTIARHPSETDGRMMVRVLAFALHAHPDLAFGRGLSTDDEPDLWRRDPTGVIDEWIDVGQPEVKLVRRAAGRATAVTIYCYGRAADPWWAQSRAELDRIAQLTVVRVSDESVAGLATLVERTMELHCTILEGEITFGSEVAAVPIALQRLREPAAGR